MPDMKIFKYPLPTNDGTNRLTLQLPIGAKILNGDYQGGRPVLWCLVDIAARHEERLFHAVVTVRELPKGFPDRVFSICHYIPEGSPKLYVADRVPSLRDCSASFLKGFCMDIWNRSQNENLVMRTTDGYVVTVFRTKDGDHFKYVCNEEYSKEQYDSEEEACEAAEDEYL